MTKINMKLRLQNKQFIIAMVSAILLLVGQVAKLFGFDVSEAISQQVMAIVNTALTIMVGVGVVQDPTTKGIADDEEVLNTKTLG